LDASPPEVFLLAWNHHSLHSTTRCSMCFWIAWALYAWASGLLNLDYCLVL